MRKSRGRPGLSRTALARSWSKASVPQAFWGTLLLDGGGAWSLRIWVRVDVVWIRFLDILPQRIATWRKIRPQSNGSHKYYEDRLLETYSLMLRMSRVENRHVLGEWKDFPRPILPDAIQADRSIQVKYATQPDISRPEEAIRSLQTIWPPPKRVFLHFVLLATEKCFLR